MRREGGVVADLIKGAIAGAVATWTLDRVADAIEGRGQIGSAIHGFVTGEDDAGGDPGQAGRHSEPERHREAPRRPSDGATASGRAAASGPRPPAARRAGPLRWGLGVGAGAVYGVVRPRVPFLSRKERMGFGSSFFVLIDEGLLSGLGFHPPPAAFPWNAETRGLAGHIVFGVVADATLSFLDRIA